MRNSSTIVILVTSSRCSVQRVCAADRLEVRSVGMEYKPHLRGLFAFSFVSLRSEATLYILGVLLLGSLDLTKLYSEDPTI
jgi:hypothetical protein